jgi:hypothetical protein
MVAEDSETHQPEVRRDSLTGHKQEREEGREVMLNLVFGHDTPFTIFDRSSRLRSSVAAASQRRA